MGAERQSQYLTFAAAGEQYALGVLDVREIVELRSLTSVPSAPRAVRGVVNLRGRAVPVFDLGLHLGMPAGAATQRSCVVVVESSVRGQPAVVGLLADAVSQVIELPAADLQQPPSFGSAAAGRFVKALAPAGEKFVLVLDLASILEELGGGLDEMLGEPAGVCEAS